MAEPVPRRRFAAAALAAAASVICLSAAQRSFGLEELPSAIPLALAGIVLAAVAARLLPRPAGPLPARKLDVREAAFLFVLLLVSAALRLPGLENVPPGGHFDEAENVLVAQRILAGERPVFVAGVSQIPALPFYPIAAAVALRGPSVATARAVSAVIGTITVLLVYLLARRLSPPPVAAAVALLAAGMRWHLNFSRVGFLGIWVPLFAVASVLVLLRALESSRYPWWIALGAIVAAGLQTYYAFNLFPFVLLVVLLLLLFAVPAFRARLLPAARSRLVHGLLLSAGTALLLLAPLLAFAARHPREFFQRSGTVAIWNQDNQAGWQTDLVTNVRLHLLMFGQRGDGNARHNIPDAPLLTSVESVLLMLGVGAALGRGFSFPGAALLGWAGIMILPGVLTIEAPQAYRTIGLIPAVLLLVGEALCLLWRLASGPAGEVRPRLLAIAFPALAVGLAAWNAVTYFYLQTTDPGAWIDFDGDAKAMARYLAEEGTGRDVFVDSVLGGFPILELNLRRETPLPILRLSDHFPAPAAPPPARPALFVLEPFREDLLPLFREAFPCATTRRHVDPSGRTMFSSVAVPAPCRSPARAVLGTGYLAAYYPDPRFSGLPTLIRVDPAILFHFHQDEDALPHPFGVDWTAFVTAPVEGAYAFELVATGPARVLLDGVPLLVRSEVNSLDPATAQITLKAGEHLLSVRYVERSYKATIRLWWTPPGGRRSVIPLSRLRAPTRTEYDQLRGGLPPLTP
jgi:4-amino-4-deoxy-L-arabinose transferase-like glycosyltransferase